MNERIKELLKQVGGISYNDDNEEMSPMLVGSDVSKFVKLIVQACSQQISRTNLEDVEGGDQDVLRAAAVQLKQHFGVQE